MTTATAREIARGIVREFIWVDFEPDETNPRQTERQIFDAIESALLAIEAETIERCAKEIERYAEIWNKPENRTKEMPAISDGFIKAAEMLSASIRNLNKETGDGE